MARPQKQGLEYFSLDVDLFENRKVRRIIKACGTESGTILIHLLCNIYRHKGYYILHDDELPFDIADRIGTTEEKVTETIVRALLVNFFSKMMHDKYKILTSKEIQERYLQGTSKRMDVHIIQEYRINYSIEIVEQIVSEEETPVYVVDNSVFETGNEVSDSRSTQSKVKDIKVNKIKVKNATLSLPPHFSAEFFSVWVNREQYRKEIKKPYKTIISEQQQINTLEKFDEKTTIAMIEQSIAAGWSGIFELKISNNLQLNNQQPVKLSVFQRNMLNLKESLNQ